MSVLKETGLFKAVKRESSQLKKKDLPNSVRITRCQVLPLITPIFNYAVYTYCPRLESLLYLQSSNFTVSISLSHVFVFHPFFNLPFLPLSFPFEVRPSLVQSPFFVPIHHPFFITSSETPAKTENALGFQ